MGDRRLAMMDRRRFTDDQHDHVHARCRAHRLGDARRDICRLRLLVDVTFGPVGVSCRDAAHVAHLRRVAELGLDAGEGCHEVELLRRVPTPPRALIIRERPGDEHLLQRARERQEMPRVVQQDDALAVGLCRDREVLRRAHDLVRGAGVEAIGSVE
jgi:hypothetical protein